MEWWIFQQYQKDEYDIVFDRENMRQYNVALMSSNNVVCIIDEGPW